MYLDHRRLDTDAGHGGTHSFADGGWLVDRRAQDPATERRALAAGLLATPAAIAPKYFYDAAGCALFAEICRLPEYYPTRVEAGIFEHDRMAIVAAAGKGKQFVDLGAGDCAKAAQWLPWLAPQRYVAVDIAEDGLALALPRIARAHRGVDVCGVLSDFTRGLDLRRDLADGATTFFYPGSSIGNFAPAEAIALLRAIRQHCDEPGSGLLIGVDTVKDPARLVAAYDDAAGVTAAFNRNILLHVNRILGTTFVPVAFAHVARYDEAAGRIEMHLEVRARQAVKIEGVARTFDLGERIHTENSWKYAPAAFTAMLQRAGFGAVRCWQDPAGDFAVYYASSGSEE